MRKLCNIAPTASIMVGAAALLVLTISLGAEFQNYVSSTMASSSSSLYDSVYDGGHVIRDSISDYIYRAFDIRYIVMSLIIITYSLQHYCLRSIFVSCFYSSFIVLTSFDFVDYVIDTGSLNINFLHNIVYNTFGSALLSSILCTVLKVSDFAFKFSNEIIVSSLSAMLVCFSLSFSSFAVFNSIFSALYSLIPVDVYAQIESNTFGVLFPLQKSDTDNDESEKKRFNFITGQLHESLSAYMHDNSTIVWEKKSEHKINMYIYKDFDCNGDLFPINIAKRRNAIRIDDVNKLILQSNSGGSLLYIHKLYNSSITINGPKSEKVSLFSVESENDGKSFRLNDFIGRDSNLEASVISSGAFGMGFISKFRVDSISRAHDLRLTVNGRDIDLSNIMVIDMNSLIDNKCSNVPIKKLKDGSSGVKESDMISNISFRFFRDEKAPGLSTSSINASGSFLSISTDMSADEYYKKGGTLGGIQILQNIIDFDMGSIKKNFIGQMSFTVFGNTNIEILKNGNISLKSNARRLWIGQKRANLTQWESMSVELQVAVFVFAASVCGFWLRRIVVWLSLSDEIAWAKAGGLHPTPPPAI